MTDRVLAEFAVRAVELLKADKGGRLVGIKGNKIIDEDIVTAVDIKSISTMKCWTDTILSL